MSPDGSVSQLLGPLRDGDPEAARALWERYFRRLVGLAGARLGGARLGDVGQEDVALSAFASFVRGMERGRFSDLADRDGLWRLLAVITRRKVGRLTRQRQPDPLPVDSDGGWDWVPDREPTPDEAVAFAETVDRLMAVLADPQLVRVARLELEGHTVAETAAELGCSERAVKRKRQLVRTIGRRELDR